MATSLHPPGAALHVVLLDVDGTLIYSNDAHARAWVAAFARYGYVIPFETVRPLIGKGADKLIPELTGLDPQSAEAKLISEARAEFFRRALPSLRPTPGARALLVRMLDQGLELVVATSAKADEVTALLQQAGVADLIQAATSADDVESSKPDPDIVQAALRRTGRHPSESIMLGDTPYDIEAATRARVPTIAFRCGGWTDAALAGAIAIYDDPEDLLRRYGESPLGRAARVSR
jgi:HAD superfamily hydrolase (TIGR01509 family)